MNVEDSWLSLPGAVLTFRRERTMAWITALPTENDIEIIQKFTVSFDIFGNISTSAVSDSDTEKAHLWDSSSGNSAIKATTPSETLQDNLGEVNLNEPAKLIPRSPSAAISIDNKAGKIYPTNQKSSALEPRQLMGDHPTALTAESRTSNKGPQINIDPSGVENNSCLSLDQRQHSRLTLR